MDALVGDACADCDGIAIYEQVFDNALVGICIMADRTFIRVNRQMETMLGYEEGELSGQSVHVVYASDYDYEAVGRVLDAFPKDNRYVHERPLVTKSGDILWCHISGTFIAPEQPQSTSVWIVQDVSARKRAEDQLTRTMHKLEHIVERRTLNLQRTNKALQQEMARRRESERSMIESREKYRVLIHNAPFGVLLTSENGEVVEINRAAMRMFGANDPAHFSLIATHSSVNRRKSKTGLSLADFLASMVPRKGSKLSRAQVVWSACQQQPRWLDATGVNIPVRGLGAAIFLEDKTDEHAASEREYTQREQLAHAGRIALAGQFAAAIAHELGQPLNSCQSYAAGLENKLKDAIAECPGAGDALRHMQRHLNQAGDIIKNVRAFVSKQRMSDTPVPISELIDQTIELLQMSLQGIEVCLPTRASTLSAVVQGNRVELQQVLANLVLNAADAVREAQTASPVIELKLSASRKRVTISVVDNGPGVPEALGEKIFEPYITTKREGLGMGLMMCQNIVESHGGKLSLKRSRKRGARFDISLPLAQESDETNELVSR